MLLLCICNWINVFVCVCECFCFRRIALTPSFSSPVVVVVVVAIVVGAASLPMRNDRYIYIYIFFILCVDCCLYCMCTAVVVIFVFNSLFFVCRGLLLLLLPFIFLYGTPIYELYSLFECSNVCALIFLWDFSLFVCYSVRWLLRILWHIWVCVSTVFDGNNVFVCVSVSIWLRQWSWKKLNHNSVSFFHVLFFKYSESSICILNYSLISFFIKLFVHSLLLSSFFILYSSFSSRDIVFDLFLCISFDIHLISFRRFSILFWFARALVKNEWHRQRTWTVQQIKTIDWSRYNTFGIMVPGSSLIDVFSRNTHTLCSR